MNMDQEFSRNEEVWFLDTESLHYHSAIIARIDDDGWLVELNQVISRFVWRKRLAKLRIFKKNETEKLVETVQNHINFHQGWLDKFRKDNGIS